MQSPPRHLSTHECALQIVKDWDAEEDEWWEDGWWGSESSSGSKSTSGSSGSSRGYRDSGSSKPAAPALRSWWKSNTGVSRDQKTSEYAKSERDIEDSWARWKADDERRQEDFNERTQSWRR
jgi:hypothetical protein